MAGTFSLPLLVPDVAWGCAKEDLAGAVRSLLGAARGAS